MPTPGPTLSEADSKALLRAHGVPVVDDREVHDAEAAVAAADALGYPIVVKLCGASIAHKTERGLVRLGMAGRNEPVPDDYEPNVFLYDNYPGGIGLSEPLYRLHDRLLRESRALIGACPCREGCPSCVGPAGEIGSRGKEVALVLLDTILGPGMPVARSAPALAETASAEAS